MDVLRRTQIAVDPTKAGTSVVRVAGELTAAAGTRLLRLLSATVTTHQTVRVLVDLANVRAFDVEGVAVLHAARDRLDESSVRLVLAGLDAHRAALPGRIGDAFGEFETIAELEEGLA